VHQIHGSTSSPLGWGKAAPPKKTPHLTPHVIPDLVRDPGENNRQQMRSWFTPAWIPACAGMTDNIGASSVPVALIEMSASSSSSLQFGGLIVILR
jgi:hypothetical protein